MSQTQQPVINFENEYQGLSYKANKPTPISVKAPKKHELDVNTSTTATKRKSSDIVDFRAKYKTEKCKFWEINQQCKFADNVYIHLNIVRFRSWWS